MGFIHHVLGKHIRGEIVLPDAFRCRSEETELSLTLRGPSLSDEGGIDAYQESAALPRSGALPGLVFVTRAQLECAGLTPRPDPEDRPYGDLHHVIECPSVEQAAVLARFATENGILRPFVKRRR